MVLSEQFVQDSFHSYLKSSLAQAKAERLLDVDLLSSAEGDLMITGPALCLYFAALRCTTNPPSVPLPRSSKSSQPLELSFDNCPAAFTPFLRVWTKTVPVIQNLPPESQHDLARVICGLEPLHRDNNSVINGISADLRAVAIEISQRRSFQDRYASDLQAAIDAGGPPSARKASFVPPPLYDATPAHSEESSTLPSPGLLSPSRSSFSSSGPPSSASHHSDTLLTPTSPTASTHRSSMYTSRSRSPSPMPTLISPDDPSILIIRETLYAAIADILATHPSLRTLLARDPPRAYFASVAFAILSVSTSPSNVDIGRCAIRSVLGDAKWLTYQECPVPLRPFLVEIVEIGRQAQIMEEEDTKVAIELVQMGEEVPRLSRLDRARLVLEKGVGYDVGEGEGDNGSGRRSVEGRAVAFANRVNGLALGMTKLKAFRERQDEVFKVLIGAR